MGTCVAADRTGKKTLCGKTINKADWTFPWLYKSYVELWNTLCEDCLKASPELADLQKKMGTPKKKSKGLCRTVSVTITLKSCDDCRNRGSRTCLKTDTQRKIRKDRAIPSWCPLRSGAAYL